MNKLPPIPVTLNDGSTIKLTDFHGHNIVLYFYPKDCTPGCTLQAQAFRDHYPTFQRLKTLIFGVSRDTIALHSKFIQQHNLPFKLISDHDEQLCKLFQVIKTKNMYGKQILGIERSTFLFDQQGDLRHEWRKVKVPNHIDDIVNTIKNLD